MSIITRIAIIVIALTISGYAQEEQTRSNLDGAVCTLDLTNRTIKVLPWDRTHKFWKGDTRRVLAVDDATRLMSGTNTITLAQMVAGKPLDQDLKKVSDLQGERAEFQIDKVGNKEVVRQMRMVMLFSGETIPSTIQIVITNGHTMFYGEAKVRCDDAK